MKIIAIILAGGGGLRMGGADKAFLPLAGHTLLHHVCERIRPQAASLLISANGDPTRFQKTGLRVLADEQPLGPLSGILAGLRAAGEEGADALLSVPVDCPFLPGDLALRLAGASPAPAFARAGGRDHHATALWPVGLETPLARFLASGAKPKIADFAAGEGAVAVSFPDETAFLNLNRPEDLARAEALTGGQG